MKSETADYSSSDWNERNNTRRTPATIKNKIVGCRAPCFLFWYKCMALTKQIMVLRYICTVLHRGTYLAVNSVL
jgi:hypothetical protein